MKLLFFFRRVLLWGSTIKAFCTISISFSISSTLVSKFPTFCLFQALTICLKHWILFTDWKGIGSYKMHTPSFFNNIIKAWNLQPKFFTSTRFSFTLQSSFVKVQNNWPMIESNSGEIFNPWIRYRIHPTIVYKNPIHIFKNGRGVFSFIKPGIE